MRENVGEAGRAGGFSECRLPGVVQPVSEILSMNVPDTTAVLLIAHGSRRAEANADLVRVAEALRARIAYQIVEIAYLELAEPTIPDGGATCVARGATRVLMLPYFLSAGEHVRRDLARYREEFGERFPGVTFEVCEPLGLHPKLIDVLAERLDEAVARETA